MKKHLLILKGRVIGANRFCIITLLLILSIISSIMLPCPSGAQEGPPAWIAADLAAGVSIEEVIQKAVDAGMAVEDAVEALILAGANASQVVYAAITANYPAESVVKGAATAVSKMGLSDTDAQAALTVIASAALQAGATQSKVTTGLASAGVSAVVIANAITQALLTPSPVFGYTAPTPPAPPTGGGVLGGGGPPIGGSGAGAPPTKVASPTKP
uniref:Uncharacterized protein n=1 Tax=Candidatus Desulfatibia profunda TaxID=2841695 RepID=A0A8J6NX62_9BACT|nr:hypothetical protein [Candidatus Desulfatibia profunda]